MSGRIAKFIVVGFIILFAVILDQWTKNWAEHNLASARYETHAAAITIPGEADGLTLSEFIAKKYPKNDDSERYRMIASAKRGGERMSGADAVKGGETIELGHASITVIPGYYDYQYARNPGAAWSFMADRPEKFRAVFFGITGVLAVVLLGVFIARSAWPRQRMLIITLGCVLGGAIGNIIDRFRYGYVIDFISWHIGDKYWPTFNIADVFVTCGVAFLIIDLLIHREEKPSAETAEKASETAEKASETAEKASETDEKASETAEKASETAEKASETDGKTSETDGKTSEAGR